ncbi:hypothetical protein BDV96DRAFT_321632 [Lophiotrema nucula]|uniref:Uncharacterized protein n=1 Tax=Lophiotrema nucula TaxID=690887 RepID=A0A6A5ZLU2_9PLEO|nr:hypothetical protein BDV96DRAFT_321632 [Lophiotrema nucula]
MVSTFTESMEHKDPKPMDAYDSRKPVQCFTSTRKDPTVANQIRETLRMLCGSSKSSLFSTTSKVPRDEIPAGEWTIAFAPRMLQKELWVVVFAAPQDSEIVWMMYPDSAGFFCERQIKLLLGDMVTNDKLKVEEEMMVGDARYEQFQLMVNQGLWAAENVPFSDWRSAEYTHQVI